MRFTTAKCGRFVGTAPLYTYLKLVLNRSRGLPHRADKVENVELWNCGIEELRN